MAVQVIGDLKREKGTHAHSQGTQNVVPNIEVIVGIPAALTAENAVVRVFGGESRRAGTEAGPEFHALQNEIDAGPGSTRHALLVRADVILFPHALLGPFDGDL